MGKVVVNLSVSADGFFAGPDGDISWGLVDEEVHRHFNDVLGRMSYFVEGRVVYQMMESHWPTADQQPDCTDVEREFARIWRETPKVVYSRTLDAVGPNATLVRDVVPDEVRELKAQATGDLSLGGATIVAAFQRHGLVDEYWLYVHPVVIGEGRPLFPRGAHIDLQLLETSAFGNGVVRLRYAVRRD
jgi:dihydrofolate reductase